MDSQKVAAITNYNFDFRVTNPVSEGGFIELVFPTEQIEVPESLDSARIQIYDGALFDISHTVSAVGLTF